MTIDEMISGLESLTENSRVLRKSLEKVMVEELVGPQNVEAWMQRHPFGMITTSLDCARDLFYSAFPGWLYRVMECSVSDDALVTPDFNHPEHGADLQYQFPLALNDPVEWFGTDVDLRPSGRPALALCISMLLAKKRINETNEPLELVSGQPE
ncbi:hypothetical protein [Rhizobium azibense]|uniref:Uncharacterized protein n=1 Tax=Rhizobium azibense TaxID=1136135 RepID=A0A4V2VDU5_9HYPH|nr:hypothetical protein [Rhizobium azibense]TCU34115.1 hypothetical protein EV129_11399 [Rhizobium azibense]